MTVRSYRLILMIVLFLTQVIAQSSTTSPTETPINPPAPVATDGFHDDQNNRPPAEESWLKQHNRYVFVIVLGLLAVALILWYIIKSIKGMRKRLREENQAQVDMLQKCSEQPPPN